MLKVQTIVTHFDSIWYGKIDEYEDVSEVVTEIEFLEIMLHFQMPEEVFIIHLEDEDGNDIVISSDSIHEFTVSLAVEELDLVYMVLA